MKISNLSEITNTAIKFTKEVTTRWNSRIAGSENCLACGDFLEASFSSFCDKTTTQKFSVNPGAFLGFIKISVVLYFLSLIALIFQQIEIASSFVVLSTIITVFEFFFYKEFIDFLYPQKKGKNVLGIIEPDENVKQQIIVSAHHDSAHVFNFLAKDPDNFNKKVTTVNIAQFLMLVSVITLFVLKTVNYHNEIMYWGVVGVIICLSPFIGKMWFFISKQGTPGAGDNMVCTAIAMEIGKYFSKQKANNNNLKHTRIIIASWDAEECGLRGSRAYVKKHKKELQGIKTYNFNLECMYELKELGFLTSDLNSFVPLSKEMAKECSTIANELGYKTKIVPLPVLAGGTDAAEFAKAGIEATTLAAMNWVTKGENPVYHTLKDTIENVDVEAVKQSIAIGINYIANKDLSIQ